MIPKTLKFFSRLRRSSCESPGMNIEAIAGIMYDTYCEKVGGVAFNGDPLPDWQTFRADPKKTKQSDAWVAAASAGADAFAAAVGV